MWITPLPSSLYPLPGHCLCVYDRDAVEEVLTATRVLLERATEMAKKA